MLSRFVLVLVVILNPVFAQTYLNGISSYEQLSKEYYLGALYLPEAQQNRDLVLSDNRAQKMVIKITASRWSPRKFEQVWRQDLALNNDLGEDIALTKQILDFTRFPKDNLTTGDVLEIRYSSKDGTEVLLNNETVVRVEGKKLFNALLRAWIGDVPNSQHFQQEVLGQETLLQRSNADSASRFHALITEPERLKLVSGWVELEKQAQLALAQAEDDLRQEKARLDEQRKRDEEARKKAEADQKQREDERKQALALAEQRKKEADAAQADASSDVDKVKQALAAQKAAEEKAAQLAKEQEEQAVEIQKTQQEILGRQFALDTYQWEVLRDVYKRVSYPEWARQFNQEGIVTVEFIVSNRGQLLGISSVTPADSGLLGQELKDAVNRAAPFNAFPVQIKERQLKMVIDYEFTLSDRVAELPPQPQAPEGVDALAELTPVQKAVQWAKYKEQSVAKIEATIEYPFWAKDLKQEGVVAADITVMADGSVKSVQLTKRTRHSILNQEVELAVDRIGNFGAFPAWIEEESITLQIEHRFKL